MKVCIDTNAYGALKRGDDAIAELLEAADEVLVSTVVLGELYAGFGLGAQEQRNLRELRAFLDKPIASRVNRLLRLTSDARLGSIYPRSVKFLIFLRKRIWSAPNLRH